MIYAWRDQSYHRAFILNQGKYHAATYATIITHQS